MHEDGADFGRVDDGVEQLGFADGSAIGAEESFAFGPSAAAGQALMGFRIGVERFGYEVGLVDEELGVEAEDGAERAFDLRGGVIAGLQATDGSFNQRVERGDVCGGGEAQHKCGRRVQHGIRKSWAGSAGAGHECTVSIPSTRDNLIIFTDEVSSASASRGRRKRGGQVSSARTFLGSQGGFRAARRQHAEQNGHEK